MPFNIEALSFALLASVFIAGMCMGSFTSVLIYRLPRCLPFIRAASVCPNCGKRITPCDLVPLLNYIILKGRCRSCGKRISPLYPFIELASGSIATVSAAVFGFTVPALLFLLISLVLLVISVIDAQHMIIPDRLVIALAVLGVLYSFTGGLTLTSRIAGFFALSLPMFLLTLLIRDAFGGGDIKLIAVCGFILGARLILLAGFIAVVLASIFGLCIKYIRKKPVVHIAFGQYICIGVFIADIFGEEILNLYFSSTVGF